MQAQSKAAVTMTLDDEMPWHPLFGGRDDVYDDLGFTVVAEVGDYDLLLGNFIYRFQGGKERPKSRWLADGMVNNNLVILTHRDQRAKGMHDNNFSRNGMNLNEFYDYDDLVITRTDDSVTYVLGDIEYVCKPPEWTMRGTSGEVEYDLRFRQTEADVVWPFGAREDAAQNKIGGGYCYVVANGTIKIAGTTYPIENGHGVHERLAYSEMLDTIKNAAADTRGFGTGFSLHMTHPRVELWGLGNTDMPMFFVTVDGQQITYLPGQEGVTAVYEIVETWHDPRSGLLLPSRWRVDLQSAAGRLELDVQGLGRAYYPWEMKRGYQVMYWHLGVATGRFTTPDGGVIEVGETLVQHEIVKLIMNHVETMEGPRHDTHW